VLLGQGQEPLFVELLAHRSRRLGHGREVLDPDLAVVERVFAQRHRRQLLADGDAIRSHVLGQAAVEAKPVDGGHLGLVVLGQVHRRQRRGEAREVELADLDLTPNAQELVLEVIASLGYLSSNELQHV